MKLVKAALTSAAVLAATLGVTALAAHGIHAAPTGEHAVVTAGAAYAYY
jgi:hypothetical protein